MMKKNLIITMMFLAGLMISISGGAITAEASKITYVSPFSVITSGPAGSSIQLIDVTPFDPYMFGPEKIYLEGVNVEIDLKTFVIGMAHPFLIPTPGGPIPVPYQYKIDVKNDFTGLAGKYFEYEFPSTWQTIGMTSGYPTPIYYPLQHNSRSEFNSATDIVGFTTPDVTGNFTSPILVNGTMDKFIDNPLVPLPDKIMFMQELVSVTGFIPLDMNVVNLGHIKIEYEYSAIPEPSTIMLLGLGVVGMAFMFRKKINK
jgi:hypothetical protein